MLATARATAHYDDGPREAFSPGPRRRSWRKEAAVWAAVGAAAVWFSFPHPNFDPEVWTLGKVEPCVYACWVWSIPNPLPFGWLQQGYS